ncbi:NAD+ synthase [Bradyrhizobium ontarionense]|uniref:Glutamine-dependent NAD(+) synthetase n=1 Tax=Bradyrhizobium ontarionense TaxID=2898149 RepID=A0ABY3RDQ0_9BRAD|nr:NAD+ synthase [Bradyrhizobium sp. A19]UFZ04882.1 NAD+ synthase [Bradyrhizobium sp. A19]
MTAADGFRITLAQLDPTVGDPKGNAAKAREARAKAAADGADLVLLPELFMSGYPPEDLVLKPAFQAACRAAIEALARETADGGPAVLIGTPWVEDGQLYNASALLDGGRIAALRFKTNLPDDRALGPKRLFARGPAAGPVSVRGLRIGVAIGDDIGVEEAEGYENVVETLAETGAEIIVAPSASPYIRDGGDRRLSAAVARVTESDLPLIYLNQVGGQDDQVFDGASFALNADLSVAAQLPGFVEAIVTLSWSRAPDGWQCEGPVTALLEGDKADYAACVLGLRDHVGKNGFAGVMLDLSGGIESALSAVMAVDALGADKVRGVVMPDRDPPQRDSVRFAANLGIACEVLPIEPAVEGFKSVLSGTLATDAHEDLLGRVRGTLLMALANTSGAVVVTATSKSELLIGRTRDAGDVTGAFAPLKDITASEALRLAALRNGWKPDDARGPSGEVVPPDLIARSSGAQQRGEPLPADDVLDAILARIIDGEPLAAIIAVGFDRAAVTHIDRLVTSAEARRRQAAPGVKLTTRHRLSPITNRFRDDGALPPEPDQTLIERSGRASTDAFEG